MKQVQHVQRRGCCSWPKNCSKLRRGGRTANNTGTTDAVAYTNTHAETIVAGLCSGRKNRDNLVLAVNQLGIQLGIATYKGWYTTAAIAAYTTLTGTKGLPSSLAKALELAYPEYTWLPWCFPQAPRNSWADSHTQHQYLHLLARSYRFCTFAGWYDVKQSHFFSNSGKALLNIYKGSPLRLLHHLYPFAPWLPWLFYKVPQGFWKDKRNCLWYLNWFQQLKGMESLAGWYNATQFDLITNGGAGLLSAYQNSILKMLKEIYPEEEWKPWLFKKASHGYWKDQAVIQEIIQKIEKKYRIGDRSSWYRVSSSQLQSVGATTAIKKRGGLYRVLTEVYPDIQWDPSLLSSTTKRSEQRILFELVKELFPDRKVLEEYYHPSLLFPRDVVNNRRRQMQLDVFVPSLNLAFEYHGFQHYQDHPRFGSAAKQQERDKIKQEVCLASGITLITISHEWRPSVSELQKQILSHAPLLGSAWHRS